MKAIEVLGLSKHFGSHVAVDRVSFDVEQGDAVGLLGPNGSGKTTLLRMLATLLKPTSGHAVVMGLDGRFQASRIRRFLGFMPDIAAMEDDLTVEEYLEFFAELNGQAKADRDGRVKGLIDLLDLHEVRDRLTGGLSRGMQQRVGLARTLVHDPSILLLDEPAANLDARARIEIRAVLQELRRMGKTIVISSHILRELEDLCTKIVVLVKGKLAYAGAPGDVTSKFKARRRIAVKVNGDAARLREALAAEPAVAETAEREGWVVVVLKDGQEDYAFVARRAIELGLGVQGLREEEAGLEDLFLRLTDKGV